ncbi:hypothetical protein Aperf_G00000060028 [Anoplocephala perfoliata]
MADSSQKGSSRATKRTADEAFGQKLMTDVPEHFNYGVFFDDGYDYMQHMKSMKEFVEDPNYVIEEAEIPEDYVPPIVEPVVEDDSIDDELEFNSDDELIAELGELEDNFVELAGGKPVRLDDAEEEEEHQNITLNNPGAMQEPSTSYLPLHKVKMMERYLYGTEFPEELGDQFTKPLSSVTADAAARKGRSLTDSEELLEKKFEKLLKQTKSRNGYDGHSMISETSVMSDSLQSVVDAERIAISKRVPHAEDWLCSDSQLKAAILHCVEEMPESEEDDDPLKSWVGKGKFAESILSSSQQNDAEAIVAKSPEVLTMPKRKTDAKVAKPNGMIETHSSTQSEDDSDLRDVESQTAGVNLHRRVEGETAEEKRARKAALKLQKRQRQQAKKINKLNFRREKLTQSKPGSCRRVVVD